MCVDVINGMADTIADLERKLAEREWIRCEDRLPEWWETEEGYLDTIPVLVFYEDTPDAFHQMAVGEYVGRWEVVDDYAPSQDPVAWMPLPEPYKGGDTE